MPVLKVFRFVVGFGVARALLFAAPIVLANILPLSYYGRLELAQSLAAIAALLLGAGLPASVPLIRLRHEVNGRWDSLLLILSVIGGGCLFAALFVVAAVGTFDPLPVLVLLATGILLLQGLWATSLKSDGASTKAVFLEAGFWSVAVVGALLMTLSGGALSFSAISILLFAYGLSLLGFTVKHFIAERITPIGLADLRCNLLLGFPLMLTSILTVLLSSSGRLLLGQASGAEMVAIYSVLFRCTAIPLIGHQILMIGFFRHIFSWPEEVLRARAIFIVGGVTMMVIIFWLFEPLLGWMLGKRFSEVFYNYRAEGLILLTQTILWSAIALNDLINSRLQIAGWVARLTAPFLISSLLALGWWSHANAQTLVRGDVLFDFARAHFALMCGYFVVQCVAASLQGYNFVRLWCATGICTITTSILFFFAENI